MAELKRELGFWTILALSVANIMGTGMFMGASVGAYHSGNASIIAWAVLTIISIYISMFFGELVSMFPKAGGIYEYSKHVYPRFVSFLMGWLAWLVGNLTVVLVIVTAINYLIPDNSQILLKFGICVSLLLVLNIIAYFGLQASGFITIMLSIVSISIILSLIVPGVFNINAANYTPFLTAGFLPIFVTMFFLAESFFGWEESTYLAEETKDPERIIPISLVLGTVVVGILGISVVIVSFGIIPSSEIANMNSPFSAVFGRMFGLIAEKAINFGIFLSLIGAAVGGIIGMPRLVLALARDKLFIVQLSEIHQKHKTPYKAIIFQAIVSIIILLIAFGNYTVLLSLLLPLGLIMYIFTILAVFILRLRKPELKRAFRVPFARVGSIFVILFLILLMVVWLYIEPDALPILLVGLSFIVIGLPIYLLLVFYYDPDVIVKVNNSLAYLTLLTERIMLPKKVRTEILNLVGDIRNKTILEFGCSVGTLTMHLAERVKPKGKVYATDLSETDLTIARKRLIKMGHMHVTIIHDKHQFNRVHPDIPHIDAVVSMGMMGYLQDVKKVLRELRALLPYNGKIIFVDYTDFFKVIPNVEWLSTNEKIQKVFNECGFSVYVDRKKGIFWNYIYVYGIKFHHNVPYA